MGFDAQKALQLSALLAQFGSMYTTQNPGQNAFAQHLLGSAQAGIQAEALRKEKKKEEKKAKGALGGSLGSALGTAAGIALAPATGGMSLALSGAAGGALGGVAGQALSGGGFNAMDAASYGVQGGLSGYSYGKAGQLGDSVENAATPAAPAAPQPAEVVANNVKNSISVAGQAYAPASGLQIKDNLQGFQPPAITPPRPKFGKRFMGALEHTMGRTMGVTPGFRVVRQPTGQPDIYEELN